MNEAKYIGLDVHQATISVSVLDSSGKLVMEAILETKAETVLQFIDGLRGSLHVTFEDEPVPLGYTICSSLTSRKCWCVNRRSERYKKSIALNRRWKVCSILP